MLWAPSAWVGGRWRESVLLEVDAHGHWARISSDSPAPPQAERLAGPLLPSLVNAHSHAFQRAFAGMAERRDSASDDFWSWRDRMYAVALRITPAQLRAVAAQLYAELRAGGYTQVCEFHYLHHDIDGRPFEAVSTMSQALIDAAADAGIGLTLLPVLYERAGFALPQLRDDQRRFRSDVALVRELQSAARGPLVHAGVAIHSLRAAGPASIAALIDGASGPVHIHVAEQQAEVDDCLAATGCRPIEWLARHGGLDARWQLVHATHTVPEEIDAVARCGAGVVICPTTEANLGDGLADLSGWLAAGVPLTLGSDSQVCRQWGEELRWLDYGQRLQRRQRNVSAAPGQESATAARLFERLRAGGAAAAGFARWGLEPGARADAIELDLACDGLRGVPASHRLDAAVFACGPLPVARTWVAGRARPAAMDGGPNGTIARRFEVAMQTLWGA